MTNLDLPIKEHFSPIQEELSTERREKMETEGDPYRTNGNENMYMKVDNKYEIVNNGINSYITTRHSKRYSIDVSEKGNRIKLENSTKDDNKTTPNIDLEKKKASEKANTSHINNSENYVKPSENNEKCKVVKIEPYTVFHTVEADRDISSENQAKNNNRYLLSTPQTSGKNYMGETRNDMKFLMEKKIKLVLNSKKNEDQSVTINKQSNNLTTVQVAFL